MVQSSAQLHRFKSHKKLATKRWKQERSEGRGHIRAELSNWLLYSPRLGNKSNSSRCGQIRGSTCEAPSSCLESISNESSKEGSRAGRLGLVTVPSIPGPGKGMKARESKQSQQRGQSISVSLSPPSSLSPLCLFHTQRHFSKPSQLHSVLTTCHFPPSLCSSHQLRIRPLPQYKAKFEANFN